MLILLLLVVPLAAAAVVLGTRVRRSRTLSPEAAEAQLSGAPPRARAAGLGSAGVHHLLGLERRLGRFAGPASEAYAGALRANRYDPRLAVRPEPAPAARAPAELARKRDRPAHGHPGHSAGRTQVLADI